MSRINNCDICKNKLPFTPKPIVAIHPKSKIIIIGQAPGLIVHKTGIPWNDKSGENLKKWMGIKNSVFYDAEKIALVPMGFCYPGRNKSGDNPPPVECAPKWHHQLLNQIETPELVILIGHYSQKYYLKKSFKKNLTETVKNYKNYLPKYFVLPHPSPRNNIWQIKNTWFKEHVIPDLKQIVNGILKDHI